MRFVAVTITLFAFAWQHGTCCTPANPCHTSDHDVAVHDHHDERTDTPSLPVDSVPDHPHHHHLCVGTHIFYLMTPAVAYHADRDLLAPRWVEAFQANPLAVSASRLCHRRNESAAHPALLARLPLRAALQVYLI